MTAIPRTRTQRVLLLLLLASATLVAASFVFGFLMRAHVAQEQRRMTHGMMVAPALPPGHPPVQGLPPGHPPIPQQPAPPSTEGIRI